MDFLLELIKRVFKDDINFGKPEEELLEEFEKSREKAWKTWKQRHS